ncbi:MAG: flagellar biosynthetic protein FliR [Alphaproteobacteria bacterium]|nr:flagellar biosynthetic protein FliR [Alphaproteobacteria bacterium]
MQTYNLDAFLSGHVFAFMMLLSRVGTVVMLFPGIGESYVPRRTRMIFACLICLVLLEPMLSRFPPLPPTSTGLFFCVAHEILIGAFFGMLMRLLMEILESAGMIIGMQSGLSNATMMNPAMATQSSLPSTFLSLAGLVLIFLTGIDHALIRMTVALYNIFPVNEPLALGDMTQTIIHMTNKSFQIGVEFAAPFIIIGLLLYSALGLLQRMLPSIQLFLILLPVEIWGGLMMFMLTVAGILTLWRDFVGQSLGSFFQV